MLKKSSLTVPAFIIALLLPMNAYATSPTVLYKFEGNVNSFYDSFDATAEGDPSYVVGIDGYAIYLDGIDDRIIIPKAVFEGIDECVTISFWQRGIDKENNEGIIFNAFNERASAIKIWFTLSDGTVYWTAGGDAQGFKPSSNIGGDKWNHWAFTKNADVGEMKIYLNGFVVNTVKDAKGTINITKNAVLGSKDDISYFYKGLIDDFCVFNSALNADEIRSIYTSGRSCDPSPGDGSNLLKIDDKVANLEWVAGEETVSHNVYFGSDMEDVENATTLSPEYVGSTTSNNYKLDKIDFNKASTYYWRVDGIRDSSVVKGVVWEFGFDEWDSTIYAKWGDEALTLIENDFKKEDESGYYDDNNKNISAYTWTNCVLILALAYAVKVNPEMYKEQLERLIDNTDQYWSYSDGKWGYDCVANPGLTNRFYDDNAWMSLAMTDAYISTGNTSYLERSKDAYEFARTGEDETFGGGIWWKETNYEGDPPKCKAVSATSGAALAAVKLYKITGEEKYLSDAKRFLDWIYDLRDENGLILNDVSDSGINKTMYTYNTAVPMHAYVMLYEVTGDIEYLEKAEKFAQLSEKYWFDRSNGTINDFSAFAFTLAEGWIELYTVTGETRWLGLVNKAISSINKNRDINGRYPPNWNDSSQKVSNGLNLLITASAARIYFAAAINLLHTEINSTIDESKSMSSGNISRDISEAEMNNNGGKTIWFGVYILLAFIACMFLTLIIIKTVKLKYFSTEKRNDKNE